MTGLVLEKQRCGEKMAKRSRSPKSKISRNAGVYAEKVVETVREPLLVLDTKLKVLSANDSFYRTFELKPKEVIGHLIYAVGNREWDIPELRKLLEDILPKRTVFEDFKVTRRFKGLGEKTIMLNARRLDEVDMILLAMEDVTFRVDAERRLKRSNARLKELNLLKTRFLVMTSHELKTPITPVVIQAQMLSDGSLGKLSAKQKQSAEMILRNITRLDNLVSDIFDISRIQSSRLNLVFQRLQLARLIEEAKENMAPLAAEKDIKLVAKIQKLPRIPVDKDRIIQVLTNLISNAIKFTPAKGTITIEAAKQKDDVLISVKDTGRGMVEKDVRRLFTLFFQVKASYELKEEGTGLGLPICKGIIEQHGGKIWAESLIGKGSTFSFTLPIKQKTRRGK